ncbi:Hypothetical predicted protein [Mytilus galloprovincialis]|uniref:Uncharacterized protein n=1 Tax=Mytilus galloprovincialis TaxID=29158 RepID=A0A8B6FYT4_MYTGA|nr:Hypothetical predicted protein [Mytilus galloprovincialis]
MCILRVCILLSCSIVLLNGAVIRRNKSNLKDLKHQSCKQRVSGFRSHNINISENCKKGEIRWTLTKQYLNLTFQTSDTKELCFSSRAPNGLQKYTVKKLREKKLVKLGTPRKGSDTCTTINKGKTTIRIDPTGTYYGLYVRYTIVSKDRTI